MRWQNLWLLLCCVGLPAAADTVWLKNGDRLTGDIVLLDGGKLALKTKYAGRVLIDWKDIATLNSSKPLLVKQSGFEQESSRQLQAADNGKVKVINGDSREVALSDIQQLIPPRPLLEDLVWEGNADLDLDMDRDDNNTNNFSVSGDSRVRHGLWRHVLDGEYEREKENGEETESNWQAEYDLDRFFTPQWFVRGSVSELRDDFGDIERQSLYGLGPGYQFWDNELGRFDLIGQLGRGKVRSSKGDIEFDAYSGEWDYKRVFWGSRMEFFSTAQIVMPTEGQIDYVFDGEAGLRYRLNEWARLSLLYELDQVGGSRESGSEEHYTLGMGVAW